MADTAQYCPVTLKREGVLVPGDPALAVRVKDHTYLLADAEAKRLFEANPGLYLHRPTAAAVADGSAATVDATIAEPPPRIFVLAPHGSGIEAHLERLSKELGVEVVSVDSAVAAHPVWGPKLQPASDSKEGGSTRRGAGAAGDGEDGEDGDGEGDDEEKEGGDDEPTGPVPVPVDAYVDALKAVYRATSAHNRGVVYSDLADAIVPDMVPSLVKGHVPPSLVVPVSFNTDKLASKRVNKEFAWVPPAPVTDGGDGDDGGDGEAAEPPTEEELEELRSAARATALADTVSQLEADKARLGEVKDAFASAGVEVAATLDINAENPERVYARLLALLQPIVTGQVSTLSTATPVAPAVATAQLESGHRRLSKFGPYCPVTCCTAATCTCWRTLRRRRSSRPTPRSTCSRTCRHPRCRPRVRSSARSSRGGPAPPLLRHGTAAWS